MKATCKRGHARTPDNVDSSGSCKECRREAARRRHREDPTKTSLKNLRFRLNNPERIREIWAESRKKNSSKRKSSYKVWTTENKERVLLHLAGRRARKYNATPAWLTTEHKKQIEEMYLCAKLLFEITGVKHQVDHVIPLKHPAVSGLHVPWNLQILTATQNQAKNNKFTPGFQS